MAAVQQIASHKSPFLAHVLSWVEELGAKFARFRLYRQTVNELSSLSNRELADLGLHHSMIKRIALQAAYENK
ncbi:DUF1127 domain-containing protein [Pseudophaeobacter sp.]|uniref:DUF1127 domain-containing protein n=1 Tax=Pseudophaeobacter sp. TaxID=1971739 RepID=UPI0040590350